MKITLNKKTFIIFLQILICIIFVLGSKTEKPMLRSFYFCYFADLIIPFSFYFLLMLNEDKLPRLKSWLLKSFLVFLLCALSETLQYFGIFALARIFDPLDYIMYGIGTLTAALLDRQLFKRMFNFWQIS